jgi:hypothetical protein
LPWVPAEQVAQQPEPVQQRALALEKQLPVQALLN